MSAFRFDRKFEDVRSGLQDDKEVLLDLNLLTRDEIKFLLRNQWRLFKIPRHVFQCQNSRLIQIRLQESEIVYEICDLPYLTKLQIEFINQHFTHERFGCSLHDKDWRTVKNYHTLIDDWKNYLDTIFTIFCKAIISSQILEEEE